MFISTLAPLLALLTAAAPAFTGSPSLSVLVTDQQSEPVPVATVQLCPLPEGLPPGTGLVPSKSQSCSVLFTDEGGRVAFRDVAEAEYSVVVSLDGFANSALFPLPIGRLSPVAPDEVVVVLNPVRFDSVAAVGAD